MRTPTRPATAKNWPTQNRNAHLRNSTRLFAISCRIVPKPICISLTSLPWACAISLRSVAWPSAISTRRPATSFDKPAFEPLQASCRHFKAPGPTDRFEQLEQSRRSLAVKSLAEGSRHTTRLHLTVTLLDLDDDDGIVRLEKASRHFPFEDDETHGENAKNAPLLRRTRAAGGTVQGACFFIFPPSLIISLKSGMSLSAG